MRESDTALLAVLRRDRLVVGLALALLASLAWTYLFWVRARMAMPVPAIPGMEGMSMPRPLVRSAGHAAFVFAMWAVMMIGMMTPSAAPMILVYAQVARKARESQTPFASAAWFAGGYLSAWLLFSLIATLGQYLLERALALSPMMTLTDRYSTGALLIAAGAYQWTRLKDTCLAHCRAPLSFVQRHGGFRADGPGSAKLGLVHGFYCIGCCWVIMALLFVSGVMNAMWIALLAAFVLVEKISPWGRKLSRVFGVIAIAAGLWTIRSGLF